jgi:hypothetical protein
VFTLLLLELGCFWADMKPKTRKAKRRSLTGFLRAACPAPTFTQPQLQAFLRVMHMARSTCNAHEAMSRLQRMSNLVLRGVLKQPGENSEDLKRLVAELLKAVVGNNISNHITAVARLSDSVVRVSFDSFEARQQVAKNSRLFSAADRARMFSIANKVYTDDDLTPKQQQARRKLWPLFHALKQQGLKPSWRQHIMMYVPDPRGRARPHAANFPGQQTPPTNGGQPATPHARSCRSGTPSDVASTASTVSDTSMYSEDTDVEHTTSGSDIASPLHKKPRATEPDFPHAAEGDGDSLAEEVETMKEIRTQLAALREDMEKATREISANIILGLGLG